MSQISYVTLTQRLISFQYIDQRQLPDANGNFSLPPMYTSQPPAVSTMQPPYALALDHCLIPREQLIQLGLAVEGTQLGTGGGEETELCSQHGTQRELMISQTDVEQSYDLDMELRTPSSQHDALSRPAFRSPPAATGGELSPIHGSSAALLSVTSFENDFFSRVLEARPSTSSSVTQRDPAAEVSELLSQNFVTQNMTQEGLVEMERWLLFSSQPVGEEEPSLVPDVASATPAREPHILDTREQEEHNEKEQREKRQEEKKEEENEQEQEQEEDEGDKMEVVEPPNSELRPERDEYSVSSDDEEPPRINHYPLSANPTFLHNEMQPNVASPSDDEESPRLTLVDLSTGLDESLTQAQMIYAPDDSQLPSSHNHPVSLLVSVTLPQHQHSHSVYIPDTLTSSWGTPPDLELSHENNSATMLLASASPPNELIGKDLFKVFPGHGKKFCGSIVEFHR
jgi:hypothetical protein